jgi:hypothetical protein
MLLAVASAGRRKGTTIVRAATNGDAPSVAAASVRRLSSCCHNGLTVRTTTATLKNTWATTIASTDCCQRNGRSARYAAPTTTVGSTKGTIRALSIARRPGNR